MPQPKATRKAPPQEPPEGDDEPFRSPLAAVRELLGRGMVLTADLVQEAVEDAVQRGRMTRHDAEELVATILALGRRQTDEALDDLERRLERWGPPGLDRVRRDLGRARRATGLAATFPIDGYDQLTAAQIASRLDGLSAPDLRSVGDYERRHGNRKTVLAAVERRLA